MATLLVLLFVFSSFTYGATVNLNTADYKTLLRVPGVTPQMAHSFTLYREKYGFFNTSDEMLNACAEADIAISEEYVNDIQDRSFIYAVSSEAWNNKVADSFYDLIYPLQIYNINTNYLISFPDGGWMLIKNTALADDDMGAIKKILPPQFLARQSIDWLIINDYTRVKEFEKNFKVGKVFAPTVMDKKKVEIVETLLAVDLFQETYNIFCYLVPFKNRIEARINTGKWSLVTKSEIIGITGGVTSRSRLFPDKYLAADQELITLSDPSVSRQRLSRSLRRGKMSFEDMKDEIREDILDEIQLGE